MLYIFILYERLAGAYQLSHQSFFIIEGMQSITFEMDAVFTLCKYSLRGIGSMNKFQAF